MISLVSAATLLLASSEVCGFVNLHVVPGSLPNRRHVLAESTTATPHQSFRRWGNSEQEMMKANGGGQGIAEEKVNGRTSVIYRWRKMDGLGGRSFLAPICTRRVHRRSMTNFQQIFSLKHDTGD